MRDLSSMSGRELEFVRPRLAKRHYELRTGDLVLAELRFDGAFKTSAAATTAPGTYRIERKGFLQAHVFVFDNNGTEVGQLSEKFLKSLQHIDLVDGRHYVLRSDFFHSRLSLETETGEVLVEMKRRSFFSTKWMVDIRYRATSHDGLTWLVMLMWYYHLMITSRHDASG